MVQVHKTILNATGAVVASGPIPLAFESAVEAACFMRRYVSVVFECGGYDAEKACWWACDATPELHLHCYTIEPADRDTHARDLTATIDVVDSAAGVKPLIH